MRAFLHAVSFLTILPIPTAHDDVKALPQAMAFFPLVGGLMGGVLALLDWGLAQIFPYGLSSAFVLFALIILTGGIHLDGLADTCDGLFGGHEASERLRIMRDSRIGTFGALALIGVLALKWLALTPLTFPDRSLALISMLALARWSQVVLAYGAKKSKEGIGTTFSGEVSLATLCIATLLTLLIVAPAWRLASLWFFGLVLLKTLAIKRIAQRTIGGVTGDMFGAVTEANETIVLLIAFLV